MHVQIGTALTHIPSVGADVAGLADLLLAQADLHPQKVAAVYRHEQVTFEKMCSVAASLGTSLQELGAAPNSCVGIFSSRSLNLLFGVWGTIFSGAAYLPLASDYPDDRLRFMIEDGNVGIILAETSLIPRLQRLAPAKTIICDLLSLFGRVLDSPVHMTPSPRPFSSSSQDLAYVIYTSGSTGKPKGVMIEQGSIVHQMLWLKTAYRLDGTKRILQKTPISFDAAQWELLAPACGATVIMASEESHKDPAQLLEHIKQYKITTLQCVPTMLKALLEDAAVEECISLHQVFSGGEALSSETARLFFARLPQCSLINLYGPTECTINASSHLVRSQDIVGSDRSVPIGKPVDGTAFFVLDTDRKPVQGGTGELYIGGVQLARGYLGRTDLTQERFVFASLAEKCPPMRLYRTGDLVRYNEDGTFHFVGRTDEQIKLRGFRIELDEIKLAIESHDWVRSAAVVVSEDPLSHSKSLSAFIELSPTQAAVMDQGIASPHHHSKTSRLQVRAQIAGLGLREQHELQGRPFVALPGKDPTPAQIDETFQRKTYRFYEGGDTTLPALYELLTSDVEAPASAVYGEINLDLLGFVLRYFGQFYSEQRLLPKYGYASPGALYATQLHVEVRGIPGVEPGFYYFHPSQHALVKFDATSDLDTPELVFHFIGKKRAIEPIYKRNVQEVLEFEAGHMVGLLDRVLANSGLAVGRGMFAPQVAHRFGSTGDEVYLCSFPITRERDQSWKDSIRLLIQPHQVSIPGLPVGQFEFRNGQLAKISDQIVEKHDVIAINQQVYERSQFGVSLVSDTDGWQSYISLGRKLQHLQMNPVGFGFMSSGYSSRNGHDLGSARRLSDILQQAGSSVQASYFAVGGRVSREQIVSQGMKEDAVHMRGPAELIKDDLRRSLPAYMMPSRVTIVDQLPLLPNGKVDAKTLQQLSLESLRSNDHIVRPRSSSEAQVAAIWKNVLHVEDPSVDDDFFEVGGNSLTAVILIHKINAAFDVDLPIQTVFEAATIEKLTQRIHDKLRPSSSRIIRLSASTGRPIFCWPGLGGYPLSLRTIASRLPTGRPLFGIQAHGLNKGETPFSTIRAMAAADVEIIREVQPRGPYTLFGYSFGSRVAFESAYLLEQAGLEIDALVLIAPGSPNTDQLLSVMHGSVKDSRERETFAAILLSVFTGALSHPILQQFLSIADNDEAIAHFLYERFQELELAQIRRIVELVRLTYGFRYEASEISARKLSAPTTIIKASGDDYSFLEGNDLGRTQIFRTIDLAADHYGLLRNAGANELATHLQEILETVSVVGTSPAVAERSERNNGAPREH